MASSSENKEPNRSIGFRFSPKDHELIQHYLLDKILKRSPLDGHVIDTFDLYSHHPEQLPFKELEDDTLSAVCVLMEKRDGCGDTVISVDGGFWVHVGGEQPVYEDQVLVGFRKNRIFERNMSAREVESKWVINELRVNFAYLHAFAGNNDVKNEVDKWIACRIYKIPKTSNVKESSNEMEDEEEDSDWADDWIANRVEKIDKERSENEEPHRLIWKRFSPRDDELIQYYLLNKVLKRPPPVDNVIETLDLYSCRPDELPIDQDLDDDMGRAEMYFYVETRAVFGNKIIDVDGGIWVQIGDEKPVDVNHVTVGFRKDRVFSESTTSREIDSHWMVNEFRVNFAALHKFKDNNAVKDEADKWIACRVIKTFKNANANRGLLV